MAAINTAKLKIFGTYSLLALTVLLPLLLPGHILTLDMVFAPSIPIPDHVTSSYLFRVLLHVLDLVLPSELIEKIMLYTILAVSGYGMHQLILYLKLNRPVSTTYLAGFFYAINPYTYSRFMAGQYSVLLGYALLPLVCRALLRLLAKPTARQALQFSGWVVLVSIVSIHTLGLVGVLLITGTSLTVWRLKQDKHKLTRLAKALGLASLVFGIASCYWVVPLLSGEGATAQTIQGFGQGDRAAFATAGNNMLVQAVNSIRLQGFWAEGRELFLLPQDTVPAWGLLAIGVGIFVFVGGRALWRSQHRFIVGLFGLSALTGLVLAVGLIQLPGYREPHKFVGLIALMYAICMSQGVAHVLRKYKDTKVQVITACCFVLLVAFTAPMFWGFSGQLRPRHYPADWFTINQVLNQDHDKFQTLFLPWHLYMHFGFAGRIVANPAPDFFDKPILVSNDPEFAGASRTTDDPIVKQLNDQVLPQAAKRTDLGAELAHQRVKYIIFAKESDAPDYDYLNHQYDLELVQETDTLKLYRNKAWKD